MKQFLSIPLLFLLFILFCCQEKEVEKESLPVQSIDYEKIIEQYLETKKVEPTLVFNNNGRNDFTLLGHKIQWTYLLKGIEISIDGHSISTANKETLNVVRGKRKDSVSFANSLSQVKLYEEDSLISFLIDYSPCTGTGCNVNYQIIYDFKHKKESYFGRFFTGNELELYQFNSDNRIDYLSKTFFGRNNPEGIDTTKFVMYSQGNDGSFQKFQPNRKEYWFKHIYTQFHEDLKNDRFEEHWIEPIIAD